VKPGQQSIQFYHFGASHGVTPPDDW
jgi:hypothetical protein